MNRFFLQKTTRRYKRKRKTKNYSIYTCETLPNCLQAASREFVFRQNASNKFRID